MAAIVHRAIAEYVLARAKRQWPQPAKRPKRPPLSPVPPVPKRPFDEQLNCFMRVVAGHDARSDEVTATDWPPVLAHYRALRRAGREQVSSLWHRMDQHRAALEEGAPIPELDKAERAALYAFFLFEGIRNQWGERAPVDRDQLPPEKRLALLATDRNRKAKSRAKQKREKEAARARLYAVDEEAGVVTLASHEGGVDAAAE